MNTTIEGRPSFAHMHVDLEPGESITAEADAMASMSADLDLKAKFNGGFFSGLCKKFLGGESLFVNVFTNNTDGPRRVTLVQPTPGDMGVIELNGNSMCLQPGAYIASTPGVKLGLKWAGFASFLGKEGLFKLIVSGSLHCRQERVFRVLLWGRCEVFGDAGRHNAGSSFALGEVPVSAQ